MSHMIIIVSLRFVKVGALSEERTSLKFTVAAGLCKLSHSRVRVHRNRILLSKIQDSPNLEGRDPVFITPRNKVVQLYPQALG
jgi:hypothetical protein